MSLSIPNSSRTFTMRSGASITVAPRLAGLALGRSVIGAELAPVLARLVGLVDAAGEARPDCIQGVGEVGPTRRGVRAAGGEGAGLAVPAAIGILRLADLVDAHPLEVIVARVELAH